MAMERAEEVPRRLIVSLASAVGRVIDPKLEDLHARIDSLEGEVHALCLACPYRHPQPQTSVAVVSEHSRDMQDARLARMLETLEEGYATLEDLAEGCHMSPATLAHRLKLFQQRRDAIVQSTHYHRAASS